MKQRKELIKYICFLLGIGIPLAWAGSGWAVFSSDQVGTAGAQFLKNGEGTRAIAMGEAYSGVAEDVTAIYWNPGGLAGIRNAEGAYTHAFEMENMNYDFIGYAQPIGPLVLASSLSCFSMLPMERENAIGESEGQFQAFDLAWNVAGAMKILGVSSGINLKLIYQNWDNTVAAGFAMDVGAVYPLPHEPWVFGAVLQNMGTPIRFIQQSDPLPFTLRLGAGYQLLPECLLSMDLVLPIDETPSLHMGGEYQLAMAQDFSIDARIGLKTNTLNGLKGFSGLTCGVGINAWDYSVDYSWVPYGELGSVHRIGINLHFSNPKTHYKKPVAVIHTRTKKPSQAVKKIEPDKKPVVVETISASGTAMGLSLLAGDKKQTTSATDAQLPQNDQSAVAPMLLPGEKTVAPIMQTNALEPVGVQPVLVVSETPTPLVPTTQPGLQPVITSQVQQVMVASPITTPVVFVPTPERATRIKAAPVVVRKPSVPLVPNQTKALNLTPTPAPAPAIVRQGWTADYYNKAVNYYNKKQFQTAYTYCQEALRWNPEDEGLRKLMEQIQAGMNSNAKPIEPGKTGQ